MKEGNTADAIRTKKLGQDFLKRHMPKFTPIGLGIPPGMAAEYIRRARVDSIPTLMIERAIADHEWKVAGEAGADRNTLIDKLQLIPALPYVDEIVSDDAFFHRLYPAAQKTGHVRAAVITFNELLKRFQPA